MNKYFSIKKSSILKFGLLFVLSIPHAFALTPLEEELPRALAGDNSAQNRVGEIYMYGRGVPRNTIEAAQWFLKASENGNPFAPNHLAVLYANGDGVEQSWQEAAKWLKVSAKRGYYLAQKNLAVAYEEGNGVEQDLVEAYVWASLAEENSRNLNISPELQQEIVATKERIECELTKDQLKEALMRLQNYRTTIVVIPATRQPLP
jgi:hypothetical protein